VKSASLGPLVRRLLLLLLILATSRAQCSLPDNGGNGWQQMKTIKMRT
jgi:hypothetical protein